MEIESGMNDSIYYSELDMMISIEKDWSMFNRPFRGFDYQTNDGCWVVGKTEFRESDNTELMVVVLDRDGQVRERDPQMLADWSI